MTTDNFCSYLQNRLIQTSQVGDPWYSDISSFSFPWAYYTGSSTARSKRFLTSTSGRPYHRRHRSRNSLRLLQKRGGGFFGRRNPAAGGRGQAAAGQRGGRWAGRRLHVRSERLGRRTHFWSNWNRKNFGENIFFS
jgi:hypothetical protein